MKPTRFLPTVLILGWSALLIASLRAGVPEPDTILYGTVSGQVGHQTYQLTQGELHWVIADPVRPGLEHRFTTALEPLAGGRFSYKLSIPHELLAYDLTVSSTAVPLTAGPRALRHIQLTVDGIPAIILPPATAELEVRQAARALTQEANLLVQFPTLDSDGDGLPDWWEDRNGQDKWDPADALRLTQPGPAALAPADASLASTTFTQWRTVHFPGDTTPLDQFARLDSDSDGIVNLLEYAFLLDPTASESLASENLPKASRDAGYLTVTFSKRKAATDLLYRFERSEDLTAWEAGPPGEFEEVEFPGASGAHARVVIRERLLTEGSSYGYARIRVELRP